MISILKKYPKPFVFLACLNTQVSVANSNKALDQFDSESEISATYLEDKAKGTVQVKVEMLESIDSKESANDIFSSAPDDSILSFVEQDYRNFYDHLVEFKSNQKYYHAFLALEHASKIQSISNETKSPHVNALLELINEELRFLRIVCTEYEVYIDYRLRESLELEDRLLILEEILEATKFHEERTDQYYFDTVFDIFWTKLVHRNNLFDSSRDNLEPGQVHHEVTKAGLLLDLVKSNNLDKNTVFYDVGSGTGIVSLFLGLFTEAKIKGVEIQEDLYQYSKERSKDFPVDNILYFKADVLEFDFSDADVIYMFTPLYGELLITYLSRLKDFSQKKFFKIISFGDISMELSSEDWLEVEQNKNIGRFKLNSFNPTFIK